MKHQLKRIAERFGDSFNTAQCSTDSYDDITSGLYYKSIRSKSNSPFLSLSVNTDGIKIFKSAKASSVWPLLVVVNEVPKEHRYKKENFVVAGLWFGKDPDMAMFMRFLIEEIEEISAKGLSVVLNGKPEFLNMHNIIFTSDSPAKAKVLNCTVYSGFYGCPYCLHPGNNEGEDAMRYPYMKYTEQRSHKMIQNDAMTMVRLKKMTGKICKEIRGIRGPSPLLLLQNFNMIKGTPVDYMHACLHGVTGKMLGLWLDICNHHNAFYIGRPTQIETLDSRIKSIRLPSKEEERSFFKASEQLTFLLYYGAICLDGILPRKYTDIVAIDLSKSIQSEICCCL